MTLQMSAHSSSPSNDSLLHPQHSQSIDEIVRCLQSRFGSIVFTAFNITCILLLLPLCTFILHHGLQQWRQKRSTSSAVTVSHSDILTFHMVTMELIRIAGGTLTICGIFMGNLNLLQWAFLVFSFSWFGQMFFHLLTCVERYLAVIHPITYMSLKKESGIWIRNISIACTWLLCFGGSMLQIVAHSTVVDISILVLCLMLVFFCSLSVLCVLIRPGPGEKSGDRQRVDQSKLRAFYTITAILGVLVGRFAWGMIWILTLMHLPERCCVILMCEIWFNLLSSLVLPLLYLQRAGKLECCKKIMSVCKHEHTSDTK